MQCPKNCTFLRILAQYVALLHTLVTEGLECNQGKNTRLTHLKFAVQIFFQHFGHFTRLNFLVMGVQSKKKLLSCVFARLSQILDEYCVLY